MKRYSEEEQRRGEEERKGQSSTGGMKGDKKKYKGEIKWMNMWRGIKRGSKGWQREEGG